MSKRHSVAAQSWAEIVLTRSLIGMLREQGVLNWEQVDEIYIDAIGRCEPTSSMDPSEAEMMRESGEILSVMRSTIPGE